MQNKDPIPKTYIDALLKERGMHANELAKASITAHYGR